MTRFGVEAITDVHKRKQTETSGYIDSYIAQIAINSVHMILNNLNKWNSSIQKDI